MSGRNRLVLRVTSASVVALVVILTVVGEDIRGFFVGAAGWKNWTVDRPFSLVTIASLAVVGFAGWRLGRAWTDMNRERPADDDRRRRLNMALFAFTVAAPMMLVNARSLGRLLVFDHPRKDLGWKAELIDLASWLSDNRLLVAAVGVIAIDAFRRLPTVSTAP